ncbi:MAG TPA: hypothetical protein VMP01_08540 [Pirellulaceae bacterium]|nr:hypothetical protein [Pirellulaceae bacterium]
MRRIAYVSGLICALVAVLPGPALGQDRTKERPAKTAPAKEKLAKPKAAKEVTATKAKLTPRQINFVKKELIPASQAGDPRALLALLSPQVAKLTASHQEGMDALLAEEGAPSIGRMLALARLQLFRAKAESAGPELSLAETVLVLAESKQQIDELLASAKKASYMADLLPKPDTLLGYRDLLFEVHVQKNELINARELVEFGKTVAIALPLSKAKQASDEQKAVLTTSFRSFDEAIAELERDMDERSLEMRLDRLDLALEVLAGDVGLKEKFFAAYAIGIDGEFLLAGFKAGGIAFHRPALKNPNLAKELAAKLEKGKMLAGNLLDKSRNLFIGLHWWRRGRYGRGPEGMGLLKSAAATKSFEASIPLLMPAKSPVPTNPMQTRSQPSPDYDRRHHYAWAWEDRQFQNTLSTQSSSQEIGRHSTETSYFY